MEPPADPLAFSFQLGNDPVSAQANRTKLDYGDINREIASALNHTLLYTTLVNGKRHLGDSVCAYGLCATRTPPESQFLLLLRGSKLRGIAFCVQGPASFGAAM